MRPQVRANAGHAGGLRVGLTSVHARSCFLFFSYTGCRVVGNGSFGVVFQAKLVHSNEPGSIQPVGDDDDVAIKKVLQDKRFKVCWPLFFLGPLRRHSVSPSHPPATSRRTVGTPLTSRSHTSSYTEPRTPNHASCQAPERR